jgi:hypothetical protein
MENNYLDSSPQEAQFRGENLQMYNLDTIPHKGIFQPEPNTLIIKGNCCLKFIGLYIVIFGIFFGITFPAVGIATHFIIFTIIGFTIFGICVIVAIIISCSITTEVQLIFSYPLVEIIVSSLFKKRRQNVNKEEIANIIFDYTPSGRGVYTSLHIIFKNGNQSDYFGCRSNPPCFTKEEIDYFNNEVKRLLGN